VILVHTSVWLDHLRAADRALMRLLEAGEIVTHPFVIGGLALGDLRQREFILNSLRDLPQTIVASDQEVLHFIHRYRLFGVGIGYVDAHLLATTRLTPGAQSPSCGDLLLAPLKWCWFMSHY
jgi:predicted nucleic acid-binding protein